MRKVIAICDVASGGANVCRNRSSDLSVRGMAQLSRPRRTGLKTCPYRDGSHDGNYVADNDETV